MRIQAMNPGRIAVKRCIIDSIVLQPPSPGIASISVHGRAEIPRRHHAAAADRFTGSLVASTVTSHVAIAVQTCDFRLVAHVAKQ
jgi:hypothetical protein